MRQYCFFPREQVSSTDLYTVMKSKGLCRKGHTGLPDKSLHATSFVSSLAAIRAIKYFDKLDTYSNLAVRTKSSALPESKLAASAVTSRLQP